MSKKDGDIAARIAAARAAIVLDLEEADDESSVAMFVAHHLGELKAAYWKKQTGTSKPTPQQVVDLLELQSRWDRDGADTFDFTLPGEVTDYVLSVGFDKKGKVRSIDLES